MSKKRKTNSLHHTDNWNANAIYEHEGNKFLVTIPNIIKEVLKDDSEIRKPINVIYGSWMTGKSTILKQIPDFATQQGYLVFYSSENHKENFHSDFQSENAILLRELELNLVEKKDDASFRTTYLIFQELKQATTKEEIVRHLHGLASTVKICFVIDRWDLVSEQFQGLYLAHNLEIIWVLAGTGSWNPKSVHSRYYNNDYENVEMISTGTLTEETLLFLNAISILKSDILVGLSNHNIGFVCKITDCKTKEEAEKKLSLFFKDKSSHFYSKLILEKRFQDIKLLKSAAINNYRLSDHMWRLSGIVDMDGQFIHKLFQQQLIQYQINREELISTLSFYNIHREHVFEFYMDYFFQVTHSLVVHNYIKMPSKTGKFVTLHWTNFQLHYGQEVLPNVMYKLKPYYPSFDYFVINQGIIYGIQVSVTESREAHDGTDKVSTRVMKVQKDLLALTDGLNITKIEYVYLSMKQQRRPSRATEVYFVPKEAPEYLNCDGELYHLLLEKRNE